MPKGKLKPSTPKCSSHSKQTGKPCKNPAIRGGTICRFHGVNKRVKHKAEQRLADLIDPDRALREAARLAYSDIGECFDDQGNLLPMRKLSPQMRAAIAGVEIVRKNLTSGDGTQKWIHKIKLWDKPKAIEFLLKHLGLLKDRVELSGNDELLERLTAGRRYNAAAETP